MLDPKERIESAAAELAGRGDRPTVRAIQKVLRGHDGRAPRPETILDVLREWTDRRARSRRVRQLIAGYLKLDVVERRAFLKAIETGQPGLNASRTDLHPRDSHPRR